MATPLLGDGPGRLTNVAGGLQKRGDGHRRRTRRPGVSPGRVGLVTDNSAGQDGGWPQRGLGARAALEETWGGLAEACFELAETEWALPTECPGWDVKDQLSHL